jgi:hypothetical protein
MKRKAIILVNDDGKLPGLSKDSDNIVGFLKSLAGGSWFDSEIEIIKNPSLTNLKLKLALQRLTPVDLCLVFFSGHGGNDGRKTHLQINNQKETIEESALFGFAEKQINFFDCCRVFSEDLARASLEQRSTTFAMEDSLTNYISIAESRRIYSELIVKAVKQRVVFYSCELNEVSYDSSEGAVYLSSFLKNSSEYTKYSSEKSKLAILVHQQAEKYVKSLNPRSDGNQNPTYVYPKISGNAEDYLPISINPFNTAHYRPLFG